MILRRITEHVKAQNWTAVALDFVIVVVGVFIGIQVANWNDARGERAEEAAFRERLYEDVKLAQARLASFLARREARLAAISLVEDMYFGESAVESLGERECTYFANSHIITFPPVEAPSISEAFAGGRIELVTDPALVRALIEVEQYEDRLRTVLDSMNRDRVVLNRMFPDAISIVRGTVADGVPDIPDGPEYQIGAKCHFIGQTPDPAFLSEIARATSLNAAYVAFLQAHARRLDAVIVALNGGAEGEGQ